MHRLYPDLARHGDRAPSAIEQEAREWIAPLPERWRPDYDGREPSDVLAVVGAMALTAAARDPAGWDGAALRCASCPVALLAGVTAAGADKDTLPLVGGDGDMLMLVEHRSSRLWVAMVTARKIWESNHAPVAALFGAPPSDDPALVAWLDEAWPEEVDENGYRAPIKWDAQARFPRACSGYDDAVVAKPARDGFSAAAHSDIVIAGARPIVELYALIGASVLEANGRWPRRTGFALPRLHGVVLRDWLDMQRWLMIGDTLPIVMDDAHRRASLRA